MRRRELVRMVAGLGPGLALGPALGGCAALELANQEPPRLFELSPKSTFAADLPYVRARLTLETPTATPGLNTARIALKPTPTRFEYYARARWIDVLPLMIQTLLLESFDNSGKIDVLGRGNYGLGADFGLLTMVREFQAEYTNPEQAPRVRVHLQTRLIKMPERTAINSASVEAEAEARNRELNAIVSAFDEALGKVNKRIVEWTLAAITEA